jgi:hypothetical protein
LSDSRAVCIIDDEELFDTWLSIEVDRLARCHPVLIDLSLPRVSFQANESVDVALKAIGGEDYVDPLYIP